MTIRHLFLGIAGLFLLPNLLVSQVPECTITITGLQGTATRDGNALAVGASLSKGDILKIGDRSLVELSVSDGATAKIGANSQVYIDASYCPDSSSDAVRLKLLSGSLWAKGGTELSKYHVTSEHFLVMVGSSTIALNARHLDTTFTLSRESQKIETRDWVDTVEVESYTFPFNGDVSTVFALDGDVQMIPWGGTAFLLKKEEQATYGFDESHISSKPQEINQGELLFNAAGTYLPNK